MYFIIILFVLHYNFTILTTIRNFNTIKKRYDQVSRETLYCLLYRIHNSQLGINQYYLYTNTTNYYIKPLLFNSHLTRIYIIFTPDISRETSY